MADRPTFVQRTELGTARTMTDYTMPELVEGSSFVELDGESEVLPGILLLPTPGHTDGHQSMVVRQGDGTVVVAGQSHETASDFSADVLAGRARRVGHPPPLPLPPGWVDRILQLDPRRVVFAHDHAVWLP